MFEPATIPGMIEPVEQGLLAELAAQVPADQLIVEFGAFFGRSTACLVNGALIGGAKVQTYDSFGCAEGGSFADLVRDFAARAGVAHLVRSADGRVSFLPVYRHFLGAAEQRDLLRTHATELRDARFDGGPIGLIHLDAPKFYQELKPVLARFFPFLVVGGVVVLQDYFYHWSASLIAAVQVLVEAGILQPERSAASTLTTRVLRTPDARELVELDLTVTGTPCATLIDRALDTVRALPLDRPRSFVPRLHLAKMQHLWEERRFAEAEQAFRRMVQEGEGLNRAVFEDHMEMLRHGFSLRRIYELDH